jgi:uncharacterized protein YyaL (SSP411 family)
MAENYLIAGRMLHRTDWTETGKEMLRKLQPVMKSYPQAFGHWLTQATWLFLPQMEVTYSVSETENLINTLKNKYIPSLLLLPAADDAAENPHGYLLCHNLTCMPVFESLAGLSQKVDEISSESVNYNMNGDIG